MNMSGKRIFCGKTMIFAMPQPNGAPDFRARGRDLSLERIAEGLAERWSDKTMSVLKNQQLTACEERLLKCPGVGIFDRQQGDGWQAVYLASYDAEELKRGEAMPSPEQLKERVLSRLAKEAALLSEGEESLLQRLLFSDGETMLISWDEITFAESLVKRMWCTVSLDASDEKAALRLAEPLMAPLAQAIATDEYQNVRNHMFALDATLHGLLYLTGFLYANVPAMHFLKDVLKRDDGEERRLLLRSLRAAYDFCFDSLGDMILLHPGLADPAKLLRGLHASDMPEPKLTQEMLLGGMNEMLPEEASCCEMLGGALQGALRPENDVDEAVEDLKIMVKQGASYDELKNVLDNMLAVMPTNRMLSALKRLELETVRWTGVPAAVLN